MGWLHNKSNFGENFLIDGQSIEKKECCIFMPITRRSWKSLRDKSTIQIKSLRSVMVIQDNCQANRNLAVCLGVLLLLLFPVRTTQIMCLCFIYKSLYVQVMAYLGSCIEIPVLFGRHVVGGTRRHLEQSLLSRWCDFRLNLLRVYLSSQSEDKLVQFLFEMLPMGSYHKSLESWVLGGWNSHQDLFDNLWYLQQYGWQRHELGSFEPTDAPTIFLSDLDEIIATFRPFFDVMKKLHTPLVLKGAPWSTCWRNKVLDRPLKMWRLRCQPAQMQSRTETHFQREAEAFKVVYQGSSPVRFESKEEDKVVFQGAKEEEQEEEEAEVGSQYQHSKPKVHASRVDQDNLPTVASKRQKVSDSEHTSLFTEQELDELLFEESLFEYSKLKSDPILQKRYISTVEQNSSLNSHSADTVQRSDTNSINEIQHYQPSKKESDACPTNRDLEALRNNYEMINRLVEFKQEHGNFNVPQKNKPLGTWINRMRRQYKKEKKKLPTPRMIEILNRLGFEWITTKTWDEHYEELKLFYREKGHSNFPTKSLENSALGRWVQEQRTAHKRGRMSVEQITKLNELCFQFNMYD